MKLSKEELEMLSDCILTKMREISDIKNITPAFRVAIKVELDKLRYLNSVVCDEFNRKQANSFTTE